MELQWKFESWEELKEWFVAYRQDDAAAVKPLFEALQRRIAAALRKKGCKQEDVQDLSQTILLKIHLHRERYNPSLSLRAWVVTIIERSLIDFWRQTKKANIEPIEEQDLAADEVSGFAGNPYNLLKIQDIQRRLDSLKPLDRQIVDRFAINGESIDEIGKSLNMTPGSIKLRLHRSRKFLQSLETILAIIYAGFRI